MDRGASADGPTCRTSGPRDRLPRRDDLRPARGARRDPPRAARPRAQRAARPSAAARRPGVRGDGPRACSLAARLSIHLIGRNYGLIPEGRDRVDRGDAERAGDPARRDAATSRAWSGCRRGSRARRSGRSASSTGCRPTCASRQGRTSCRPRSRTSRAWSLRRRCPSPSRSRPPRSQRPAPSRVGAGDDAESGLVRIYLIYDQRDGDGPRPLEDFLFEQGFEVILPVFDGRRGPGAPRPRGEPLDLRRRAPLLRRRQRAVAARASCARSRRAPPSAARSRSRARAIVVAPPESADQAAVPHARGARDRPAGGLRPAAAASRSSSQLQDRLRWDDLMIETTARTNPFPGLRSFEPDEDHLFFGRESRIDELLTRLRRSALPLGRRHLRQRQVVADPLGPDPLALQRRDGQGRLELAGRRCSVPARTRSATWPTP